jgi:hypothetical protein
VDVVEHKLFRQVTIPVDRIQTLAWHGDALMDWAHGHRVIRLDTGAEETRFTSYGSSFDAAVSAQDGRHAVIYQRVGTKGLLLRDGKLVRELTRSYYHAEAYEYPVGFTRLPDGRTGLVHCPSEYCRLEIEDALTGELLTGGERKPSDFFHSRPMGSPGGTMLLSAGWVWHPWDAVVFCNVEEALRDPKILDDLRYLPNSRHVGLVEESAAAWIDDNCLVLAGSDEPEDPEEAAEAGTTPRLRPCGLAVYDVRNGTCLSSVQLPEVAGTIMPVGRHHVVSFYKEPKLISLKTGAVIHRWSGVDSGQQMRSICGHSKKTLRPLALDSTRARFAVASDSSVTWVQLRTDELAG